MSSFFIFVLVVVFNLYIGYKVWQSDKKQATNRLFFLLIIELSLWMIFNYYSKVAAREINQDELFLLTVRIVMAITALIPYSLYLFSLVFPNKKLKLSKNKVIFGLSWVSFNVIINLTPIVFNGTEIQNNELMPIPSWGMALVMLNMGFFILAGYNFFTKVKLAKGLEKIRLRYLSLAFVLMMVIISFFNLFLVVFLKNSDFLNFGIGAMSLVLAGFIGYALLKIRFTSIDFLIAKGLYYTTLAIWVFIFAFVTNRYFFLNASGNSFFNHFSISRIGALLSFIAWLYVFLKIYLDFEHYLIKKIVNHGFDWKKESKKLFSNLSQEYKYENIILETIKFFLLLIKNQGGGVVGDFFNNGNFMVRGTNEFKDKPEKIYQACKEIWQEHNAFFPIIFEEIHFRKESGYKNLACLMKKNGLGAIFPIMFYTDLRGVLVLGHKNNGDPYFIQDVDFVEKTLAQIAIILNKAVMYQATQDFNEYLQKKIDRATVKLVKTNQKLVLADKMKDEFVSVASHELRTPMTAIKNYLWLVRANNVPEKIKQNQKFIEIALNSTDRLIEMVNNMLTISRIEGNRYAFNHEIIDLNVVADSVYHELKPIADNKNINFSVKQNDGPVIVSADKNKIIEVLQNLVGNALKFTIKGGATVSVEIEKNTGIIKVADTGPGIEKADHAKLFKKFCRLENSYVKIKETGTGLGLYIARQIMRKHGGDITFTSQIGVGSTFVMSLPLHKE